MKKGKITICITIAIACFALATVMCMQFKVVKETDITSIETMREEELRTELANWKKMYKEAQEQYNEKTAKLAEYKEKEQSTAGPAGEPDHPRQDHRPDGPLWYCHFYPAADEALRHPDCQPRALRGAGHRPADPGCGGGGQPGHHLRPQRRDAGYLRNGGYRIPGS